MIIKKAFEPGLGEFRPREFGIIRPDDVPKHLRRALLEQFEFARRERDVVLDQLFGTATCLFGTALFKQAAWIVKPLGRAPFDIPKNVLGEDDLGHTTISGQTEGVRSFGLSECPWEGEPED